MSKEIKRYDEHISKYMILPACLTLERTSKLEEKCWMRLLLVFLEDVLHCIDQVLSFDTPGHKVP